MVSMLLQLHDKPADGGGIARVVEAYSSGLAAHGWQVTTLRLSRHGEGGGLAVRPTRTGSADDAGVAKLRVAATRSDAVLLHLGFTLLSPALIEAASASPLYVQLHDVSPFCPNGLRLRWPVQTLCQRAEGAGCVVGLCAGRGQALATTRAAYRLPTRRAVWRALCARAAGFLAPSQFLADEALRAGVPANRLHRIRLPVDMAHTMPSPPPSANGATIAYVGLLSEAKGAPLLLEALALLPKHVTLAFYGEGPAAAAMRIRASRDDLSGRVRFMGQVNRQKLRAGLISVRLLAHPSLVPEGFGLSGPEAMILGRPVVGFGRGGSGDWLVDGQTGLVAAPATAAALAKQMQQLLNDDTKADKLGSNAAIFARQNYAPDLALGELAALLALPTERRQSQ